MTSVSQEWLATLAGLMDAGTPCVLVTVLEVKGSTPREAGTKMVVTEDTLYHTIGGGNLEHEATEEARKLLAETASGPSRRDYALGPKLAQCCGGAVSIMMEPFWPVNTVLYLFGAGHVGKEIVNVLAGLPLKIKWVDERAHEFPDAIPSNCEKIVTDTPRDVLNDAPAGAYILVMTHLHPLDFKIVRRAFEKNNFAYLGLIGSKTKRKRFESMLVEDGVAKPALKRLTCPIGVAGITGKHPREIAVAVAAELLQLGVTRAHPSETK